MKQINYRGGIIKFLIPDNWEEEYEEEGGGTFYEDTKDSGTLRLNVLTFQSKSPLGGNAAADSLAAKATEYGTTVEELPNKNSALISYRQSLKDEDEDLTMWYWEIANIVPPSHARFAVFSYCLLAKREDEPAVAEELALLHQSLRQCQFSSELGE